MSQLLAGHSAGFRVRAQNDNIAQQFNTLNTAAQSTNNYWAVQAINTLRSLASGYSGDNVYVSVDNRYADGRTLFKIVMPGCEAYVRHESNGELMILKIQASADYAQMQELGKKPGYFELEYNTTGRLAPALKNKISRDYKTVVVCGGHPSLEHAAKAASNYVKAMKLADPEDISFVHTPSDSNSFRGNRRINSRKADRDPAMRESAQIVRDLMVGAQGIGKIKWMTQGAGSGIMYQALTMQGGQGLDMKGHWLYLAAPTTSAPALEQKAVTLGFTTDRDNKYYDSLNPDQLIGSGRLTGGNILTAWRRLRSGRDAEYTALKFGVDTAKELTLFSPFIDKTSVAQKALIVTGASIGAGAGIASAITGLGIALLGVGGIAFQSFFPEEYHNSKDKF